MKIRRFYENRSFQETESNQHLFYRSRHHDRGLHLQYLTQKQAHRLCRELSLRVPIDPIVEKYGVEMPKVSVRKMKTLWGSCSVAHQAVTFNFYLIKARMPYIDYVVLHELVHFLYPNHSKHFYAFLSNHMPDWKERKFVLDQDVVHGL